MACGNAWFAERLINSGQIIFCSRRHFLLFHRSSSSHHDSTKVFQVAGMNEWEAKYRALCMGISNPEYIENAEKMFKIAMHRALTSPFTLEQCVWALIDLINIQMNKDASGQYE
jgi:hypothetical protein